MGDKKLKKAKQLADEAQGQEVLRAPALENGLLELRRNSGRVAVAQANAKMCEHAVLLCNQQQAVPIDARKQFQKAVFFAYRRRAFAQHGPFVFERCNVRQARGRQRLSHGVLSLSSNVASSHKW